MAGSRLRQEKRGLTHSPLSIPIAAQSRHSLGHGVYDYLKSAGVLERNRVTNLKLRANSIEITESESIILLILFSSIIISMISKIYHHVLHRASTFITRLRTGHFSSF